MQTLWQDLRYGVRMLLRQPGFTLIAIVTLATGIAANSTIFSVVDALALRPFDFANQDRLVMVYGKSLFPRGSDRMRVVPGDFIDWQAHNRSFEQLIAINQTDFDLTGVAQPERFFGYRVSAGFFETLGVKAALGRTFITGEDAPERAQVVVLKHRLWQRRFAADPNVIGRTLKLNGQDFTVIGVMPPGFDFPFNGTELWAPLAFDEQMRHERRYGEMRVLGLLKPGVSIAQADADLNTLAERARQLYPATNEGRAVNVLGIVKDFTRPTTPYMPPLVGTVVFVLLIACANVANMLFSRGFGRQKEIVVRLALGASRWRLIRLLLAESMLLSLCGGALGLLLAIWSVDLLKSSVPEDYAQFIPGFARYSVNRAVLWFTLLVAVLTGLLCGLAPAWQASRPNLNETLKEGTKGASPTGGRQRLRSVLVIAEVALSFVLLIGAGLMVRSFITVMHNDIGFDPHNVLTLEVALPENRYEKEAASNFFAQLLQRLAALPGVTAAGANSILPLSGSDKFTLFQLVGRTPFQPGHIPNTSFRVVTPGYFNALNITLRQGRDFTAADNAQTSRVVVVNETFVRQFFPNESALGQRVTLLDSPDNKDAPLEIVGVVGDSKDFNLDERPLPTFYVPHTQTAASSMGIVLRTAADPTALTAAARAEVLKLDPAVTVSRVRTLERTAYERTSPKRLLTWLLGVFAGLALLLAGVGLYAVMAYDVMQRTHEIGIRLALGAPSHSILWLMTGRGLKLTLTGLALGVAGAFGLTRVLAPLLFGVEPKDPMTYALILLMLAVVAFLACWIPARRATKVDPMIALRTE